MTDQQLISSLRFSLSVFALSVLACSGDSGPTEPLEVEALAVITGPDQVTLGCLTGVEGVFNANQSSGPISAFRWEVDGTEMGQGIQLKYNFEAARIYGITLEALNQAGTVVATDTKNVTASPPTDLVGCLIQGKIFGKEGLLLRTGQTSVSSEYRVTTASLAQGAVGSYNWTLAKEGGASRTIASGPDAHSVQIKFTEGGLYEIGLVQILGTNTLSLTLPVKIYTGEPVSEAGTIAFHSMNRREGPGIYLMDGETGHVQGPVVARDPVTRQTDGYGTCDQNHIVFSMRTGAGGGRGLWQVSHDGSHLRELVEVTGNIYNSDIRQDGTIVYVDDTRLGGGIGGELGMYFPAGTSKNLSGNTVNQELLGYYPSWSPDGTRIVLGFAKPDPGDLAIGRISIVDVSHLKAITTTKLRPPPPPGMTENEWMFAEGVNGVAWDPLGEFIAYTVIVSDSVAFTNRHMIALTDPAGARVQVLVDDRDAEIIMAIYWSPNGEFLLYTVGNGSGLRIWQVPRAGGAPVNLSSITFSDIEEVMAFCKEWPS